MKNIFVQLTPKRIGIALGGLALFLAIVYFIGTSSWSTSEDTYIEKKVDEAFGEFISAYTSGDISVASSIRLRFNQAAVNESLIGTTSSEELFSFSPSLKGKAKWVDVYTIEFTPDEWMVADKVYEVKFELGNIFETENKLKVFEFNFHTIRQDFEVITGDLQTSAQNMKVVSLSGKVNTADVAKIESVEAVLRGEQNGKNLTIAWNHLGETEHEFTISNISRTKDPETVTLNWDGNPIGVDKKGSKEIKIPALGDFKVLRVTPQVGTEQFILITFSDPIDPTQDLTGLITTDKNITFKFVVEDNFVKAYPSEKIIGTFDLTIHAGVKNVLGYKMKDEFKQTLVFEQVKPAVRLVGNGIIVPKSTGLVFPFEAVSLKAVDVTITEIFENNVVQFFQTNNIDGNNQLKRVARPIFRKSLILNKNKLLNLNKWNRFTIDLAELITPTPGSIYQVEIAFRQSQAVYQCSGEVEDELKPVKEEDWTAESYTDYSYWDYYEEDYYQNYDWNERDNPCHSMYYSNSEKFITRNILASNLGIISKIGKDNKIFVAVTDITTTQPIENATVQVFDFQQQVIASGTTNGQGIITLDTKIKPFLVRVEREKDVNYLKVDDGSALSLSNFNVGGTTVQKGLKGFIYGERGVWRPGDTLFMTFILEDKNKTLPKNHPVIFELRNPDGKVEDKQVKTSNVNGFYTYQPVTAEEAMTGGWTVRAKVGNTIFSERVKIETIKPNRLKINLDFGKNYLTVDDKNLHGNLEVAWLHGGIAKNMKAEFELVMTKAQTRFEKYEAYTFEDQSRNYDAEIFTIFDGQTDENGKAKVPANINIEGDAPGILNATFKGKVFEPGGDFSIDQFTIPYYPYNSFVGLRLPEGDHRGMLLTDKKQPIDILSLSPKGVPTGTKNVHVQVYKIDWCWWWDQTSNSSSNYLGINHLTPLKDEIVKLTDGKGKYDLQINYPDWGRYYIKVTDVNSGHSAGKIFYMDWPGWAGKAKRDLPDAASMLTFTADKEKYSVGETMKLTVPGSGEGNALVSIETGSKVLETYWMPLNKGDNQFNITISDKMAPNVFVHVTALQPHAQTINDHPIRMYGVIPIDVVDESTHLHPVLSMPEQLSPGKKVPIQVSEKDGKPMTFTVAVVDEGLLSLTKFKTPNPWPHFYQHEALGVNTWDSYKYVLGAYGGEIEKILAVGGDASIVNKDGEKTKRFKPVIRFFGPYHLESGKKNIEFVMPNYIGAVRTMVVAGHNGAYGNAEKETPVRQSLMVQGTLPRVLSPGEKLKLPVSVFAYENNIGTVTIKVKSTGPLKTLESTKTITSSRQGDQLLFFDMEVASQIGVSKVEIEATAGDRKSTHTIDIEIRNPNPEVVDNKEKVLQPGETITHTFKTVGMKGTNSYAFEASTVPPLNLSKRLDYLLRYPHGCVEQTTSAAFPQLFLNQLLELTPEMKNRVEMNIKQGIERLSTMQLTNGGFSYWPSQASASDWGSTYAGHFLVLAKKKGYYVNSEIIANWKNYQTQAAQNWTHNTGYYNSELTQAYRLYTLALADKPEKGAMNRLKEKPLNKTAQFMLAAAYALTGRDDIAKELIASAPPTIKDYREYWYTYGSRDRDEAMLLLALNAMKDAENGMVTVKKISQKLNNTRWMSTQETSFSLLAISDFMTGQPVSSTVNMNMTFNGEKTQVLSQYSVFKKDIGENELTDKTITITNTSKGVLYVNFTSVGQPLVDSRENSGEIIEMDIDYRDKDGNPMDVSMLTQSKDFLLTVTIRNGGLRGDLQEMALTTIFPSGWEIQNARMDAAAAHYQSDAPEYQDFRDDRVHTYFDIKAGGTKKFTFLVNATYAGEFTLPGIQCEAMYDNAVQAYSKGGKSKVVK